MFSKYFLLDFAFRNEMNRDVVFLIGARNANTKIQKRYIISSATLILLNITNSNILESLRWWRSKTKNTVKRPDTRAIRYRYLSIGTNFTQFRPTWFSLEFL